MFLLLTMLFIWVISVNKGTDLFLLGGDKSFMVDNHAFTFREEVLAWTQRGVAYDHHGLSAHGIEAKKVLANDIYSVLHTTPRAC